MVFCSSAVSFFLGTFFKMRGVCTFFCHSLISYFWFCFFFKTSEKSRNSKQNTEALRGRNLADSLNKPLHRRSYVMTVTTLQETLPAQRPCLQPYLTWSDKQTTFKLLYSIIPINCQQLRVPKTRGYSPYMMNFAKFFPCFTRLITFIARLTF